MAPAQLVSDPSEFTKVPVEHPEIFYPGPDILCFRGPPPPGSNADGMNAVVMSNVDLDWKRPETWTAMIDRSPCGTGTCAVRVLSLNASVLLYKGLIRSLLTLQKECSFMPYPYGMRKSVQLILCQRALCTR